MVKVIFEFIVSVPATVAFVVAVIVISSSSVCAFVLNNPPLRKLPLFASGGTTVPCASPRYCTKIFPVPLDGAAENVKVVPSGIVYAAVSCKHHQPKP